MIIKVREYKFKMTAEELEAHLKIKANGSRKFKDKTKYSRKKKHK